jgi:ribosome-associated translation inhibitor RaiA
VGKSSATTRTAQARRDAKSGAAQQGQPAASSSSSSPADAKSSTKSKKRDRRDAAARRGRGSPLIEVRAASSVKGSAGLDAFAEQVVTAALSRFLPRLTRIDVHLSDDNAAREGGTDKRCQIEAHPASQQPVSASATAATLEKALTTAANHMKRLLTRRLAPHVRG